MRKLFFSVIFICALLGTMTAAAANGDITVLYTNDVHSYINNKSDGDEASGLTYSKIAALADAENALLVDAGDHAQGTAYGGMDEGATITQLMNAAGYDCATLGNHEFDYGVDVCKKMTETADFPYLSCNFREPDGSLMLDGWTILEAEGKKLAFVGITTPETIRSGRHRFMNEAREYIYSIDGITGGDALYQSVQTAIDAAKAAGADYVLALGHLGIDPVSEPWTSRRVIANTEGLDAFIDGHSHSVIESETVLDRNGDPVILTQTGYNLNAVGKLTIAADGTITSTLLTDAQLPDLVPDPDVLAIETAWIDEIEVRLGETIGYAEITLDNFDEAGNRLVRRQETNTGDFATDALYWFFENIDLDIDCAILNGGSIRNGAITGPLSYKTCKDILTFGNSICLKSITGQELLDALEWSVSLLQPDGSFEEGSFLQVSGIRFTADLTFPSTVQSSAPDTWGGSPTGAYRVRDVEVYDSESDCYLPLDLTARYNIAGTDYYLNELNGGYSMFKNAHTVLDHASEDYLVLAEYIRSFPVDAETGLPTISAGQGYDDRYGSGRITFVTEPAADSPTAAQTYIVRVGDSLWRIAQEQLGAGNRWRELYDANRSTIRDPDLIFIGQTLLLPA